MIINPYNLLDSSFLLSFLSTIGIIYFYPKIKENKIKNKFLKYFYELFIISISVNIFIFPITIYYFKKISISFFITGLVLSPLVFIIEILGLCSIILPSLIINIIAPITTLLVNVFIIISKINLGRFYFKVPNIIEIILYYIIIIYLFDKSHYKFIKKTIRKIIVILLII